MSGEPLRPTTDHDRAALKRAVKRLIGNGGGQMHMAEATRVGGTQLNGYGNPNMPDCHIPIDILADLTIDADDPRVVVELCRIANGAFVPLPKPGANCQWGQEVAHAVREGGTAAAALCTALADDGDVSADEIRDQNIMAELSAAIEALCQLRSHCDQVLKAEA